MQVDFSVRSGRVGEPLDLEVGTEEYDPDRDHTFFWLSPRQLAEEIHFFAGRRTAFVYGWVPIGMCAYGGDYYFAGLREDGSGDGPVVRVFYDWVRCPPHLPEHGVQPIAESLVDVVATADLQPDR